MEKFQIAKYGLMQVAAVVYGILACGATVKFNKGFAEKGCPMPHGYYAAMFVRDYGFLFFGLVIIWVIIAAYGASTLADWNMDGDQLALTGIALAILLAVAGTIIALWGATSPVNYYTPAS